MCIHKQNMSSLDIYESRSRLTCIFRYKTRLYLRSHQNFDATHQHLVVELHGLRVFIDKDKDTQSHLAADCPIFHVFTMPANFFRLKSSLLPTFAGVCILIFIKMHGSESSQGFPAIWWCRHCYRVLNIYLYQHIFFKKRDDNND
jgi:hypothetical protein